jgi:hypothetical protein
MYNSYYISCSVSCTSQNNYELPEEVKQLRPKHVAAISNKKASCNTGVIFYIHIILRLLNCITKAIQVPDGREYFPRGPYVGQLCTTPWQTHYSYKYISIH